MDADDIEQVALMMRDQYGSGAEDYSYPSGVGRSSGAGRDDGRFDVRLRRSEGKCPQTRLWTQTSGDGGIGPGRRL
jgi:hypothetical protein